MDGVAGVLSWAFSMTIARAILVRIGTRVRGEAPPLDTDGDPGQRR